MVDPRRLRELLDRLADEVQELRALGELPTEELLSDRVKLSAAKYGLVVAVEICIDVGQHVIASEGLRAPEDFADVFASLAEAEFIAKNMVAGLQDMARFRNLLVHVYERVDERRVIEILKTQLADFDKFRQEVIRAVTS